ncbi:MAG: RNA methyltransferase [Paracoccaceae bacterium]
MALTDRQPVFVLVRPQMGENIGAAARGMWNFGLNRMAIVAPRDGWPNPRAIAMASGAGQVLSDAVLSKDTPAAVANCAYVFATTARARDLSKPVMTPERAMQHARALCDAGQRVAVLFGPERAGLENADVALADAIISVPVNAQSALLLAYEWARQTSDMPPEVMAMAGTQFASKIEVEKLGDHFEAQLDIAGLFYPPDRADGMKLNLRAMWGRLALTRADVQALHGMLRQMKRWKERG